VTDETRVVAEEQFGPALLAMGGEAIFMLPCIFR
jgi:hypothetical protein